MYKATFDWSVERNIFAETSLGARRYAEVIAAAGLARENGAPAPK
jgi:hypothetical protein